MCNYDLRANTFTFKHFGAFCPRGSCQPFKHTTLTNVIWTTPSITNWRKSQAVSKTSQNRIFLNYFGCSSTLSGLFGGPFIPSNSFSDFFSTGPEGQILQNPPSQSRARLWRKKKEYSTMPWRLWKFRATPPQTLFFPRTPVFGTSELLLLV